MTKKADTQVESAPEPQKSETPVVEPQPKEAQAQTENPQKAEETRSEEQVETTYQFQQSRADKLDNTVTELSQKIEDYKYLDVVQKQLTSDDRFQQDITGAWSLKTPESKESEVDPDDYATQGQVKKAVEEQLQPIMQSLGLLGEQNKLKEMGIEATQEELIRASNTSMSAAQIVDYDRMKKSEQTAHQDGVDKGVSEITGQIKNAQSNSASIANANSVPEPVEEPKTEDEVKNDGIKSAIRGMNDSTMEISYPTD